MYSPAMPDLVLALTLHDGSQREFRQTEGPAVIGRDASCAIMVDDDSVSGIHCDLAWDDHGLTLRDRGSRNGTWIDGVAIDGPATLPWGGSFRLGAQGPRLVARRGDQVLAGTRALPMPLATPAAVGPATLQRVVLAERTRGRRALMVVAVVAALAIAALAIVQQRGVSDAGTRLAILQDQLARREADLAALGEARAHERAAVEAERAALSKELAALERRLDAETPPVDWAALAERYQHGLFLCVGADESARKVMTGTAFAVDGKRGVLVTNAHVAEAFMAMPARRLIQNGTGAVFSVVTTIAHPRHRGARSPDLAVLIVIPEGEGAAPIPSLPLASFETLIDLKVGSQVGTLGFPGELTREYLGIIQDRRFTGATATFKTGWIGRLTNYSGANAPAEQVRLLQHSASLSQGTSGSPLFLGNGEIVGISNAAVAAQVGGSQVLSAAEIGFAIRVDELAELLVLDEDRP